MHRQFSDNVYRDPSVVFRVGSLPSAWRRVQIGDGKLAFHHGDGGAILVNGTCEPGNDVSLDLLTSQMLMGVRDRREISRAPLTLDGRLAQRLRIDGTLDGVAIALDLVVLKKDGCVFDLALAASPRVFEARRRDFERLFLAFGREAPS